MDLQKNLRKFIIGWNNTYPIDKWFRDRYKIPFNSPAHLEASQADILLEYIEYLVWEDHEKKSLEQVRKATLLGKGEWIQENDILSDKDDELYDKIDFNLLADNE